MRNTAAVLTVLVAASCTPTTKPISSSFSPTEMAACEGDGSGTITGQAFLRTVGGDVRYGAGETVRLFPGNSYTRESVAITVQGLSPSNVDMRMLDYTRETQANGQGEFEFTGLPACDYVVATQIYWHVPYGMYTSTLEGGVVAENVKLANGESVNVILTR